MNINYNVTGAERKSLVGAISQELNAQIKYLGAPTFAYEVGEYTIDKTGTVTGPDNRELIADLYGLHSFGAVTEEYDTPLTETPEKPAFEELAINEREELGLGQERHDPIGENGMQASDVPEPDNLTIEYPLDGFTPEKLDNLTKIVNAKAPLLKEALGAEELPIQQTEGKLLFPWFNNINDIYTNAYSTLISLLCTTAKEKKRVTAKEKTIEGSAKFAMRCFLLSLGMIGSEYKAARKILLSSLEGNSSWKNGVPSENGEQP